MPLSFLWLPAVIFFAIILSAALYLRDRHLFFALGWTVITAAPTIFLSPFIAPRYLLFPFLGIGLAFVQLLATLFARIKSPLWIAVMLAFILFCSTVTVSSRLTFRNPIIYFSILSDTYPQDPVLRKNRDILFRQFGITVEEPIRRRKYSVSDSSE